jgi:hypothetical protein
VLDFENKDIPNERRIDYGAHNKIKLTRKDPYGFWYVSFERGQLPEYLKGAYTTYSAAEAEVMKYIAKQGRDVKTVT